MSFRDQPYRPTLENKEAKYRLLLDYFKNRQPQLNYPGQELAEHDRCEWNKALRQR